MSARAGWLAGLYAFGLFTAVVAHLHPTAPTGEERPGWSRAPEAGEAHGSHSCPVCAWWHAASTAWSPATTPLGLPAAEPTMLAAAMPGLPFHAPSARRSRGPPLA